MKTVVLMPVKNEGWILEYTLKTLCGFADSIIVADQRSADNTREICSRFQNVTVIDNDSTGHDNSIRWKLLDEARKIEGRNLILCIDADEMISRESVEKIRAAAAEKGPGSIFVLPWIQVCDADSSKQRIDGVWKDNNKACAFYDDGTMDYERQSVINDHTARVPGENSHEKHLLADCPLLHFHFAAKKRTEIKQAWYRCSELIASPGAARRINRKYAPTFDAPADKVVPIPQEWLDGVAVPSIAALESSDDMRLSEIKAWFNRYGTAFFEPLQIWHIPELKAAFIDTMERDPRPKAYPAWLDALANLKNRIIRLIK